MNNSILNNYRRLVDCLMDNEMTITTMESCTGGQIASYITDIEGSSNVIKGAYVTYANETKILNGVRKKVIDEYGVYSLECAKTMAKACKDRLNANIGVGVTGTFSNADENNADSIPNHVYVSILLNDEYSNLEIKIDPKEILERYEFKDIVANYVALKLLDVLQKNDEWEEVWAE